MSTGKSKICGCGHEAGRHALVDVGGGVTKHIGACSHGCRCTGLHKRRRHRHEITDPGGLLAASKPVVVGTLPVVPKVAASLRLARAFDELRDATIEALKPQPIEGLASFMAASLGPGGGPMSQVPAAFLGPLPKAKKRAPDFARELLPTISLPKGELAILTACAQHEGGCDRAQLTALTGYKTSTRNAYISRLFEKELVIEVDGFFPATKAGRDVLGPSFTKLPTGKALRDQLLESLPEGESLVLRVACSVYPKYVTRAAISEGTGYTKVSTRNAYIYRLAQKKLVLLPTRETVVASKHLFDKSERRA